MTKFKIITLGCKVNQCESEALDRQLQHAGGEPAGRDESADLAIINTCTVTGKAAMQSRQAIRRVMRDNAHARIVVTGCYAQTEPDAVYQVGEGKRNIECHPKELLPSIFDPHLINRFTPKDSKQPFAPLAMGAAMGRTRPFLKIQDGCDAHCTYCIVPYARGSSRSMPVRDVFDNLKALKAAGFHETVLTGIHLGDYGRDLAPPVTLSDLLDQIQTRPVPDRIRLSSIEPGELTDRIIDQVAQNTLFCRHFHIPLQSGDDTILKRMARPYTAAFFNRLVSSITARLPDAAIGVDILVGFPGESAKAFENTYALIEALPVSYLHVFPFSARPGTPAARYADPLPPDIIKARCRRMRMLARVKRADFYRRHIGQIVSVLVEDKPDRATGQLKGLTSNYIHVLIDGQDNLKNRVIPVRITDVNNENQISGEIVSCI